MGVAADEAKKYLNQKQIPQLFESLMTGLMYNKPEDPLEFMQRAVVFIQNEPETKVKWDMFIENPPPPLPKQLHNDLNSVEHKESVNASPPMNNSSKPPSRTPSRPASVFALADTAQIPSVPVVLFIGGPGGGKTKHAVRVAEELKDKGLVHVCLPKLIRDHISKYKQKYPEWKDAANKYESGELIPGELALAMVKAEMGRNGGAKAYLLEGFPREMNQIRDFERDIKRVDMAIILDYDEQTLRKHMKERELADTVLNKRVEEFKVKSLPAAKFFDDKYLLHLIEGEKGDEAIYEEMKDLVEQAMKKPLKQPTPPPAYTTTAPSEAEEEFPKGLPNDAPVVLVVGAPGSQKSEYCKRIAKRYDGFVHLSMGELLRKEKEEKKDDPRFQAMLDAMNKGELLPTNVCRNMMYRAIHDNPKSWGYVIEGYPRVLEQAQDFEKQIDRIDLVLLIDSTEQFCLGTLRDRAENANKESDVREDDTPEAVKRRLAVFKSNTLPMLKYFDEKGKLKVIAQRKTDVSFAPTKHNLHCISIPGALKAGKTVHDTQKLQVDGDKGIDEVFQEVVNYVDGALFIPQENASGKSLE